MKVYFSGKKISSMLCVLPETESLFDDEVENYAFPRRQTMRLKKVMGYGKHRLAKDSSTVSDFATVGLRHMLKCGWLAEAEIGAIVVVTLCPDHFVPHISNIVQKNLKLNDDILCMDIAQGCCGFLLGLYQSFLILEHMPAGQKVVLVNGDVLSHKISRHDRNDFPLIGDGTSLCIVENDTAMNHNIPMELHTDGSRGDALKIPAGGFRMPSTPETGIMQKLDDGNQRSLDNMWMDGSAVFNFVQEEVPPLLARVFHEAGATVDDFDAFLFHQPNKFMLQKLAEKAQIPFDKLPMNLVENYGNLSGACIPFTAALNLRERLTRETLHCCLSAFGSGLAWGVALMDIGPLAHCELLESNL